MKVKCWRRLDCESKVPWLLWIFFFIGVVVLPPAFAFVHFPGSKTWRQKILSCHSVDNGLPVPVSSSRSACNTTEILLTELPIFPLRNFPRVPTDRLTLNLYEERYLQMAEYITMKRNPSSVAFGALYVAGKPQLVTHGGRGPVVPLVEPGDMGTLFALLPKNNHKDAASLDDSMIPTIGGTALRRRIQLNTIGVARFRIEAIVSNGSTLAGEDRKDDDSSRRPYIVVNASLVLDHSSDDGLNSTPWSEPELTNDESGIQFSNTVIPTIRQACDQDGDDKDDDHGASSWLDARSDEYYHELWSFFRASQQWNGQNNQQSSSPRDLDVLLKLTSTRERLHALQQRQQRQQQRQ